MRVDFFQKFFNLFKNKSIKYFRKLQKETDKKVLIFVSSYSPFGNMKQREEHLFKQFVNDGYIIAWSDENLNNVVELAPNIYGYPMKDTKKLVLSSKIKKKVILSVSTHYTFDNTESIFIKATKKNIKVIYEHLDDISLVDKKIQKKLYKRFDTICKNDDIIITATADNLYRQAVEARGSEKNIVLAKNGVDLEIFGKTRLNPEFEKFLNKPIVGYYGCIVKEWFDFETLEYAIRNNSHLNFVLIGIYRKPEVSHLFKYDNFLCLDKMPFEELLKYSKHFSVAIIPFLLNDITAGTSPVKMFEYMAQGLPIVTTSINECKNYKSCLIANNKEEFSQLLNKALELKDNKEYQLLLQKEANDHSWKNVYKIMDEAMQRERV